MSIADDMQMAIYDYQVYKEQKDALEADILMLKESMDILHELVKEQGEELKTIEDEICMGKEDVASGQEELQETNYGFIGIGTVIGAIIGALLLL
jgi:t-SNARE complex subunit (syntaxin)